MVEDPYDPAIARAVAVQPVDLPVVERVRRGLLAAWKQLEDADDAEFRSRWSPDWRRGYLAGFVTLVALVVLTQIATAIGVGAWFPYAAPALWMGLDGADAALLVIQLLLRSPCASAERPSDAEARLVAPHPVFIMRPVT